jgi:uncharacterized membrane protein YadS
MGMSDKAFGAWARLAVDNTTLAKGAIYSKAALAFTTVAKLCRGTLMAFVILGFRYLLHETPDLPRKEVTRKGRFL